MSNGLKRVVSALMAIPLVILAVFTWKGILLVLLSIFVSYLGLSEYFRMIGRRDSPLPKHWKVIGCTTAAILIVLAWAIPTWGSRSISNCLAVRLLPLVLIAIFSLRVFGLKFGGWAKQWTIGFGVIYVGYLLSYLILIRTLDGTVEIVTLSTGRGMVLTFYLLSIIWTLDTTAYWIGKNFGRRRICPGISSGKTWVGSIAGFLGALAISIFWGWLCHFSLVVPTIIGVAVGVFGQIGDWFESLIKRECDEKDSGTVLPGHGGILDRIDSLLFAAPIFYALAEYLK